MESEVRGTDADRSTDGEKKPARKAGTNGAGSFPAAWKGVASPVALLLLLLTVIYANSFHGPFHFDDLTNIVDNPNLQADSLSVEDLARAVRGRGLHPDGRIQRPVSFLSLALNHRLHGLAPFGYHLVNFAIHGIATLLLFFLTIRIVALTPFGRGRPRTRLIGVALLSTALWASHPIQVTAVTYIVQRMTSLAGLFTLISMYGYLEARTAAKGPSRAGYGAVCLVSGLLAVGSKENAAMLPVNLALIEFCLLSVKEGRYRRRTILVAGAAVLAVGAVGFWLTDLSSLLAGYDARPFSLGQRLMTEPRVFLYYIGLLLYPVSDRFTMLHDIGVSTGFGTPWSTVPAVLIALAFPMAALAVCRRSPLLSFSMLFFWVNHLIEGTVVPLEIVFEHRNYLPSMFFFLPPAAGCVWLLERYPLRHPLAASAAALLVVFLSAQGHTVRMRNGLFSHPLLLWADNVDKSPGLHRPHHNLSNAYFAAGLSEKALAQAKKALEARPAARKRQKYITWYNIGTYYLYKGRIADAEACFGTALTLQPDDPKIYHKMAVVNQIKGNLDTAEAFVREALRRGRGAPDFLPTFAMILLKKGQIAPVVKMAAAQLKKPGADDQWYYLLGEAFRHRQDLRRAAAFFALYGRRVPNQIAPTAALLEIYDLLGMEAGAKNAARRLFCLSKGKSPARLLQDYHLRYNTLGMARIARMQAAFAASLPGREKD